MKVRGTSSSGIITSPTTKLRVKNSTIYKDGHLVCKRYFCQTCLKYECDIQTEDNQKKNWLCPLCQVYIHHIDILQGICSCSRCQRSDILQKLKRMYTESGGELQDLNEVSYFEQLVSHKKKGNRIVADCTKKELKERKASSKVCAQESYIKDSTEKLSVTISMQMQKRDDNHQVKDEDIFLEESEDHLNIQH